MKTLILASASPRRQELLAQVGLPFTVITSDKTEHYSSTEPADIVQELALLKAQDVAAKLSESSGVNPSPLRDAVILGADTIVSLDGQILGKPADKEQAFSMLRSLSGRDHQVYTGVAFLSYDKDGVCTTCCHAEETLVFVQELTKADIQSYIDTGEPMDKAGSYGIQGRFAAHISRIVGDYYNVVGLPISYVWNQLRELA